MSCDVGRRCSSDPELLCLWRRLAVKAPIRPLAWEPPYAAGTALEKAKRQKKGKMTIQKLAKDIKKQTVMKKYS